MNPPKELRSHCEKILEEVQLKRSPKFLQDNLENLKKYLISSSLSIDNLLEYVLIPLFLAHPAEPENASNIPERIREETLLCISQLVIKAPTRFKGRADIFFPSLLRPLATLTDMERDGQLSMHLKEETKLASISLISSLIDTQDSLADAEKQIIFHCIALLLDLSRKTEKSKDIRILALETLLRIIQKLSTQQIYFIFPGATSILCDLGRYDFKVGFSFSTLALNILRICIEKVLADKETTEIQDKTEYFEKLYPLLIRIWHEEEYLIDNKELRLSRTHLIGTLLTKCYHSCIKKQTKEVKNLLFKRLIFSCADDDLQVSSEGKEYLNRFEEKDSLCEDLLLTILISLGGEQSVISDSILCSHFMIGIFLLESLPSRRIQTIFECSQKKILWSLILAYDCDSSRFNLLGKLEFSRFVSSTTLKKAHLMLSTLKKNNPEVAKGLTETILEAISACIGEENERDGDDYDNDTLLLVPKSKLPQCIHLLQELLQSPEKMCRRLIELDTLWNLPTTTTKKSSFSPIEIQNHALIRAASLEFLTACAESIGVSFKFLLVEALFPILQSIGDEQPGVKISAEICLSRIAVLCQYSSVSQLLQLNVDYVVDSLLKRLPQFAVNDNRFAEVIEALIERIPVWVEGEENPSPWIKDLVFTILTGLDDRGNSPQVAWSLLRIAEVVVDRGSMMIIDESLGVESESSKINPHDEKVNETLKELTSWMNVNNPQNEEPIDEEIDEESEDKTLKKRSNQSTQVLESIEQILRKCSIFFSDFDVLVRQQSARVASKCIALLGRHDPDRGRQTVHEIWPSIVQQMQEEKHPTILALLLESLLIASRSNIGIDFFTRRFSEDAWPVFEFILEKLTSNSSKRAGIVAQSRDLELAKRIVSCLSQLNTMLTERAEKIALVTFKIFSMANQELKRLTVQLWTTLIQVAGDVIWLPVALALKRMSKVPCKITIEDEEIAVFFWKLLNEQ